MTKEQKPDTSVRIELNEHGRGKVFVAGHDVSNLVRRLSFSAGPGESNTLTLEIFAEEIIVDSAETVTRLIDAAQRKAEK